MLPEARPPLIKFFPRQNVAAAAGGTAAVGLAGVLVAAYIANYVFDTACNSSVKQYIDFGCDKVTTLPCYPVGASIVANCGAKVATAIVSGKYLVDALKNTDWKSSLPSIENIKLP